jgi:hypothetical protein
LKITIEKTEGEWDIEIQFPQLDTKHDKILASTEALSFLQSHGDLSYKVLDLISEAYGPDVATGSLTILNKAMGLVDGDDSLMENKTLAEMPVVDGIYIDAK